jgi:hypothetical protein
MRRRMLVLTVALAACSGRTESGAIGPTLDLRQFLPDSLRSIAPAASDSTYRQQFAVGPDSARVEIVWKSFTRNSGRFLSAVSANLVAPAPYDSLRYGNISGLHNSGTKTSAIESAKLQVAWFKHTLLWHRAGVMNFTFDAAGSRTIGPTGAQ